MCDIILHTVTHNYTTVWRPAWNAVIKPNHLCPHLHKTIFKSMHPFASDPGLHNQWSRPCNPLFIILLNIYALWNTPLSSRAFYMLLLCSPHAPSLTLDPPMHKLFWLNSFPFAETISSSSRTFWSVLCPATHLFGLFLPFIFRLNVYPVRPLLDSFIM